MKENMLSFEFLPKLASIGLSARLLGRSMQLGPLVRVKCTFFTRIERIPIKTGDFPGSLLPYFRGMVDYCFGIFFLFV